MPAESLLDPAVSTPVGPVARSAGLDEVLGATTIAVTNLQRYLERADVTVSTTDLVGIERLARRLEMAELTALARLDAAKVAEAAGATGTDALYGKATRTEGSAATRKTRLARRLDQGLGETRRAMTEGSLSTEHAEVIARAVADLPDGLTAAQRHEVERHLVEQARQLDPQRLRRVARRALEAIERSREKVDEHHGTQVRDEERVARASCHLSMWDNGDGTTGGWFTIPTLAAATLRKILEAMTAPRRRATPRDTAPAANGDVDPAASGERTTPSGRGPASSENPGDGPGQGDLLRRERVVGDRGSRDGGLRPADSTAGAGVPAPPSRHRGTDLGGAAAEPNPMVRRPLEDYAGSDGQVDGDSAGTDWARARGLAFASLLERLPTDQLSSAIASTVIITIEHEKLISGLGAAGLDTGEEISASEARRIACLAGIVPAVLGTGSLPLDLGQRQRLFSTAQRLALATLYDSCVVDGCDRPFAWSEIHHIVPWARGGRTDLTNAVPACAHHHHRLDDPEYDQRVVTDGRGKKTIFLSRRTC